MKKILVFILFSLQCPGQINEMPECIQDSIAKQKSYRGNYFTSVSLSKMDDRMVYTLGEFIKPSNVPSASLFLDENCAVYHKITYGGIRGISNYKQSEFIKELWRNDSLFTDLNISKLLEQPKMFQIQTKFNGEKNVFNPKSTSRLEISWKEGLKIIENEIVVKTYKIIPKEKLLYNYVTDQVFPMKDERANAILFTIGDEYWMIYKENETKSKINITLLPSGNNEFYYLVRTNKKGKILTQYLSYLLKLPQ